MTDDEDDSTRKTYILHPEHLEIVKERADQDDVRSQSEALRSILTEYDKLNTECERLRNQRNTLIQQRQETQALVEYVEDRDRSDWSLRERLRWLATGKEP